MRSIAVDRRPHGSTVGSVVTVALERHANMTKLPVFTQPQPTRSRFFTADFRSPSLSDMLAFASSCRAIAAGVGDHFAVSQTRKRLAEGKL